MRNKFFFLFFLILCSKLAFSFSKDSIKIQGNFLKQNELSVGQLYQFGIEKKTISNFEIKNGKFSISLPSSIEPGVYRLQFGLPTEEIKPFVDLIVDGLEKSIVFDIRLYDVGTIPVFHESNENIEWYNYLNSTYSKVKRLNGLFKYLSDFHDEKIDRLVKKTYSWQRDKYYYLFSKFVNKNENTWAGLLVKNHPYYYSDLRNKPVMRDFIRKNFFWEDIDTGNAMLVATPLYRDLIDEYLEQYYFGPMETYTVVQKEYNIKKGIDVLIEKFSNNAITKVFVTKYLKDYFKKLNRQDLIVYVDSKR